MVVNSAIKGIIDIRPATSTIRGLEKTTVAGINETSVTTSPYKYAILDNRSDNFKIQINYEPTQGWEREYPDEKLIVSYYPEYRIYGDGAEKKYEEFEDYDENDTSSGSWKLPSEWDRYIVEGALAYIFAEKYEKWMQLCELQNRSRESEAGLKLKSSLGVSNNRTGRSTNPYNRLT